jgi:hypothetical protein
MRGESSSPASHWSGSITLVVCTALVASRVAIWLGRSGKPRSSEWCRPPSCMSNESGAGNLPPGKVPELRRRLFNQEPLGTTSENLRESTAIGFRAEEHLIAPAGIKVDA